MISIPSLIALYLANTRLAVWSANLPGLERSLFVREPSSMGDVGGREPGHRWNKPNGTIDASFLKNVNYGPEYGVEHKFIKSHPFNFDDTETMKILNGSKGEYRVIKSLTCFYTNTIPGVNVFAPKRSRLIGIKSTYELPVVRPGQDAKALDTHYHGFTPTWHSDKKSNDYRLIEGETFTSFSIRACDGHFSGFRAVTNSNTDAISCGTWRKQDKEKNCEYHELTTPKGQHVVALYGDAKGTALKDDDGIRGLGLATMAGDCCDH